MPRISKSRNIIILSISALLYNILLLFYISLKTIKSSGTTFYMLFNNIIKNFYTVSANNSIINPINNVNIFALIYYLILSELIILLALSIFFKITKKRHATQAIRIFLVVSTLIKVFIFASFQQLSRQNNFCYLFKSLNNRTKQEKNLMISGEIYKFSLLCKDITKGRHTAVFITDMDCGVDPCMIKRAALAYFLYPKINYRIQRKSFPDYKILFYVNNPYEYLSNGEEIIINYNNRIFLTTNKDDNNKSHN